MGAIETRALTKRFGDVTALNSFDLTVERGEIFGFLGPNGAGKSTTINILLDLIRPTSGSASVLGLDPQQEPEAVRMRCGVLPEGYELYGRLSGRRHVRFAIEMKKADDGSDEILSKVGLSDDADRAVSGYSKGMRQRLAFGMALVGDPEVLVLDEPFSGLDPNGVRALREIVREESERDTTVFFSSHDLERVETLCDRVGIISNGELVTVSTVEELRGATGSESTLILSVDDPPDREVVTAVDGVTGVEVDGSTVRVCCTNPGVKADVIARLNSAGTGIDDVRIEERSLEDLFGEYTAKELSK